MPDRRLSPLTALTVADFGVVTGATLATAVAGLVVQDLLPKDSLAAVGVHGAVLVGLLAVLYWVLARRTTLHRTIGTIFHVQVLDENMEDLRATARTAASDEHMSVRSIIRWVDIAHRTDPATGVVEVVDVVAEVGDALQAQINLDSDETGYTLAPVMLWPMALALGTQLAPPKGLRLRELQSDPRLPSNIIELDREPRRVVESALDIAEPDGSGRFGVFLALTAASHDVTAGRWPELGVSDGVRLGLGIDPPAPAPVLTNHDLEGLAGGLAAKLVEIRMREPDREIVVVSTVPKTVALAIGWHIARQRCRFFRNTHLMHYDHDTNSLLPMRVRESQPRHTPRVDHA